MGTGPRPETGPGQDPGEEGVGVSYFYYFPFFFFFFFFC